MIEDITGPLAIIAIFVGLPWLILHYLTKWKAARGLSLGDEAMHDELHDLALRLDDRRTTLERIIAADRDEPSRPTLVKTSREG